MSEQTMHLAVLQLRTETDYEATMDKAHRMLLAAARKGAGYNWNTTLRTTGRP